MSTATGTVPASPSLAKPATQQLLFRDEVLLAKSSLWMGAIRLAQPISTKIIAGLSLVIAACLLGFITLGTVTKKAKVTGLTIPAGGTLSVSALSPGILTKVLVKEGATVTAGQPLFELSTERQGSGGELTALVGQQLQVRKQTLEAERRNRIVQHNEKRSALNERMIATTAEISQLQQEIALAQRRLELSKKTVAKFEALQTSGFVSTVQSQQKQEELIDLSSRASTLERAKLQLESTRQNLEGERDALASELASIMTQLDRSEATLKQEAAENQNRKVTLIVAPQAGMVATIGFEPGQVVTAGQSLAALIPQAKAGEVVRDELEVQLYAPSRTAGFVAEGQTVNIRYQAFPYQKFGLHKGTVINISRTPFAPSELPPNLASTILSNAQQTVPGFNTNEALYRIRVRLARQTIEAYGKHQPLRSGMTLEADIVQDQRRIWEWIAEPLLAAAAR